MRLLEFAIPTWKRAKQLNTSVCSIADQGAHVVISHHLCDLETIPVIAELKAKYPKLWADYCARAGRTLTAGKCGLTSYYPVIPGSKTTRQSGSLGVSGYVSQEANEGTITYVEYSYAINANFPVAKLLLKQEKVVLFIQLQVLG
jgi:hypothetical protein